MTPSWTAGQTVQLPNSKEADLKYLLPAFARSSALLWMRAIPHPLLICDTTKLVNTKMQLAGARHSPDFSPATFSLRLEELCGALSTAIPDQRDLLWTGTSEQGGVWGLSRRAAWVWGINSYLFVRKNSRKHWTSPPQPSTLLGWTNALEAEPSQLLGCAHRRCIGSGWKHFSPS